MKPILFALIVLFPAILFTSCGHKKCKGGASAGINFTGYDSTSLEKVVLKTFPAGNNFSSPTSVTEYYLSKYPYKPIKRYNNFIEWPYDIIMAPGSDYEIDVTNTGKKFRITEIVGTDANSWCGQSNGAQACYCYNDVSSYKLDGVTIETGKTGGSDCQSCRAYVTLTR